MNAAEILDALRALTARERVDFLPLAPETQPLSPYLRSMFAVCLRTTSRLMMAGGISDLLFWRRAGKRYVYA